MKPHFIFLVLLEATAAAAQTQPPPQWYRGNTHTHTINSDGDASPDTVARWYKEHRYHFVVLSDHDLRTQVETLNGILAAPGKFLVLAGVEVTDDFRGAPVHLIGLGINETALPQHGPSIPETINRNVRAVRAAGGLAHLNHPNFVWALTAEDIIAATEVTHFELFNGHPQVNNRGGGPSLSSEEIWDKVLSTGRVLYGLATDDAHYFRGESSAARPEPGRGWVMVRAPELARETLLAALERGDFYASTGVQIKNIQTDAEILRLELPEEPGRSAPRFRTYFIGKDGAVLKRDDSFRPFYKFTGTELYVRARVESSTGAVAWTQPVFPGKK